MASVIQNRGSQATKLTRGFPANLGTISTAGQVVAFTIPEPTRDNQGALIIQVSSGVTLGAGTFALEVSIDGALTWAVLSANTYTLTGQPGADAAAVFMATYTVAGLGSGAQFRFGFVASPTSGTSSVFALVG